MTPGPCPTPNPPLFDEGGKPWGRVYPDATVVVTDPALSGAQRGLLRQMLLAEDGVVYAGQEIPVGAVLTIAAVAVAFIFGWPALGPLVALGALHLYGSHLRRAHLRRVRPADPGYADLALARDALGTGEWAAGFSSHTLLHQALWDAASSPRDAAWVAASVRYIQNAWNGEGEISGPVADPYPPLVREIDRASTWVGVGHFSPVPHDKVTGAAAGGKVAVPLPHVHPERPQPDNPPQQ